MGRITIAGFEFMSYDGCVALLVTVLWLIDRVDRWANCSLQRRKMKDDNQVVQ